MKIYRMSQSENTYYDTYDSVIVAAESEDDAKRICPSGFYEYDNGWMFVYGNGRKELEHRQDWANNLDNIECEFIGVAKKGVTSGVLLASFNAG